MKTNTPAEAAVIGAALLGNPSGVMALDDQDFTDAKHRTLATVIRDLVRRDRTPDAIQVSDELARRGWNSALSGVATDYVHELAGMEKTPYAAAGMFYAKAVRTCTRTRLAAVAAQRLASATREDEATDLLPEIIATHIANLADIPPELNPAAPATPATIADLLASDLTYDWLIEGLIEHRERVVVVAGEGGGKSVLSTQWAIALAGGLHPFTGNPACEPARVLLIDTENGIRQTQRRYEWVGRRFPKAAVGWAKRIQHHIHTEGLDLAGKDRAWLMKAAADCSPDLIVVGPAYKVMRGDPQRDNDVMGLFTALDEVRTQHNAALFIETHGGHGKDQAGNRQVRPYGSSVWLRWPEIGIGLRRGPGDGGGTYPTEYLVEHWRGAREERAWPEVIERGGDHQLPWSPVGSDYWSKAARKGITK